mmetsp:Transcript_7921/g.8992  ORF Transcript_7921/g.8992 Transcript_7921/m.8992 type:complete len:155 (-) Transcript_7921:391-855(-)
MAEKDIINMHEQKKIDFERKIKEMESQEIAQRKENQQKQEKRKYEKEELDEKIQSSYNQLQFITKSKNLNVKNIKNADEMLVELNLTIEKLRADKISQIIKRNKLQQSYEETENRVERFDPEFVKKLREDLDLKDQNLDNTIACSESDVNQSRL